MTQENVLFNRIFALTPYPKGAKRAARGILWLDYLSSGQMTLRLEMSKMEPGMYALVLFSDSETAVFATQARGGTQSGRQIDCNAAAVANEEGEILLAGASGAFDWEKAHERLRIRIAGKRVSESGGNPSKPKTEKNAAGEAKPASQAAETANAGGEVQTVITAPEATRTDEAAAESEATQAAEAVTHMQGATREDDGVLEELGRRFPGFRWEKAHYPAAVRSYYVGEDGAGGVRFAVEGRPPSAEITPGASIRSDGKEYWVFTN